VEENTSRVYVGPSAAALTDPLIATPAAGAGTSLFIINLCASIAPIQAAGKAIPGLESYKLYQVARNEDGRTRHRLRLGFFTSEADAEQVLATVRDNYPTAFVTCLSDDDRRYARGFVPDPTQAKRPVAIVEKPAPVAAPVAAKPAAPKTVAPPATAKPAPETKAPAAAAKPAVIEVARQPEAPIQTQPKATAKAEAPKPTPVVDEIELSWDPPALKADPAPSAPSDTAASIKTIAPGFKTDTVIKARPVEPAKPKAAATPAKQPAPSAPIELTLTLDDEPVAKPAVESHSKADAQPFHVGKGVDIPASALTLEPAASASAPAAHSAAPSPAAKQPAPAAKTAAKPAAKQSPPKAAPAVSTKTVTPPPAPAVAPTAKVPAAASSNPARQAPELDSTQTIRALTTAELDGEEKWYSIQLVVSEQPVNLDAMPHLDIFEAYRVYSVANAGSGKIVYSLRLGFFREEVSAQAVGGYLKTFFPSPSVMRISTAEQLRFKDAPAPKATAIAKSEAKVIELNQARDRKPPTIPTVTMEVDTSATGSFKPGATGSFNAATGSFKPGATGSFKVNASGTHKALKPAAKTAPPATKRSAPLSKAMSTGKHKAMQTKKSLQEQLLDEAREVQLSESAIRKLPKNDSLLSRLVGKLTK
jgi:SPOR domain